LEKVYRRVEEFHSRFGALWEPAPLLKRLAKEGQTFASLDAQKAREESVTAV
jgi:3-hydroxyacyl-CoA dehydrogenase